jgi:hypothetical protein
LYEIFCDFQRVSKGQLVLFKAYIYIYSY